MTLYRINMDLESNDCKCGACDLLRGVLVAVEPTDRICRKHGRNELQGDIRLRCRGWASDRMKRDCEWVDVVRVTP